MNIVKFKILNMKSLRYNHIYAVLIFNRSEQEILFRLRSITVSGIRNEFRGMYMDNISCPVCPQDSHNDTIHTKLGHLPNPTETHSVKGTKHLTARIQHYISIRHYEAT